VRFVKIWTCLKNLRASTNKEENSARVDCVNGKIGLEKLRTKTRENSACQDFQTNMKVVKMTSLVETSFCLLCLFQTLPCLPAHQGVDKEKEKSSNEFLFAPTYPLTRTDQLYMQMVVAEGGWTNLNLTHLEGSEETDEEKGKGKEENVREKIGNIRTLANSKDLLGPKEEYQRKGKKAKNRRNQMWTLFSENNKENEEKMVNRDKIDLLSLPSNSLTQTDRDYFNMVRTEDGKSGFFLDNLKPETSRKSPTSTTSASTSSTHMLPAFHYHQTSEGNGGRPIVGIYLSKPP